MVQRLPHLPLGAKSQSWDAHSKSLEHVSPAAKEHIRPSGTTAFGTHSAVICAGCPSCAAHVPFEHDPPSGHSLSLLHGRHWCVLGSHRREPHSRCSTQGCSLSDTQICPTHLPLSQAASELHNAPSTPFWGVLHIPALPQTIPPLQSPATSLVIPTGSGWQIPGTRLQALHGPVQSESQQKPSTHFPLAQSPVAPHFCPTQRFVHPISEHSLHPTHAPAASHVPGLPPESVHGMPSANAG